MRGAYKKGAMAAQEGLPLTACPYLDKRKPDGRLSWSRAFRTAWRDGWNDWKTQQAPAGAATECRCET
jgi:hypothetical protein